MIVVLKLLQLLFPLSFFHLPPLLQVLLQLVFTLLLFLFLKLHLLLLSLLLLFLFQLRIIIGLFLDTPATLRCLAFFLLLLDIVGLRENILQVFEVTRVVLDSLKQRVNIAVFIGYSI